jgi:hypothetical protein
MEMQARITRISPNLDHTSSEWQPLPEDQRDAAERLLARLNSANDGYCYILEEREAVTERMRWKLDAYVP